MLRLSAESGIGIVVAVRFPISFSLLQGLGARWENHADYADQQHHSLRTREILTPTGSLTVAARYHLSISSCVFANSSNSVPSCFLY
jgi:hypothetical protein